MNIPGTESPKLELLERTLEIHAPEITNSDEEVLLETATDEEVRL